jgi:hypothetical protein
MSEPASVDMYELVLKLSTRFQEELAATKADENLPMDLDASPWRFQLKNLKPSFSISCANIPFKWRIRFRSAAHRPIHCDVLEVTVDRLEKGDVSALCFTLGTYVVLHDVKVSGRFITQKDSLLPCLESEAGYWVHFPAAKEETRVNASLQGKVWISGKAILFEDQETKSLWSYTADSDI